MPEPKPYYLVAVPSGPIIRELERLQKEISRRFQMYEKPFPSLHVTVSVIAYHENISSVLPILQEAAADCSQIQARIEGQRCFNAPFLSVGVAVHSKTLSCMAGLLEGRLLSQGFSPRSFSDWDFHISLVSPHFARREWTNLEYTEACRMVERYAPHGDCILDRLELWEPEFPPLRVLGKFPFDSEKRA